MKQIAILGPTASGKTALSISLADKHNGVILSLDSLSIYKEIDIASAKPTKEERGHIKHFGIDEIYPNEYFNAKLFFELYNKAKNFSINNKKNLIIVGGTSFYLKSLLDGLSPKPTISVKTKLKIKDIDLNEAYDLIKINDKEYAKKISINDKYRIEKWLEIFFQTGIPATKYYKMHKKKSIIKDLNIFELDIDRITLKKKIAIRTKKMIKSGLIDEIFYLEKKYSRYPKAMKAIGIKETLEYLDGYINLDELLAKIADKTAQLAKRQSTFNKTQFKDITKVDIDTLKSLIELNLKNS